MCSVDPPDVPDPPDPAAEAADIFLGEQDTDQEMYDQTLGLKRFRTMLPEGNTNSGLRIV